MKKRAKQLVSAVNAQVTFKDVVFLRKHLDKPEQVLFYRMTLIDQRHALDTAYHLQEQIKNVDWIDKENLIKVGLFHDVGKSITKYPVWGRVLVVLFNKINKRISKYLAKFGENPNSFVLFRICYVYENHPMLGAELLKELGGNHDRAAKIISMHHNPPQINEPRELPLLRLADEDI